MLLVLRHVCVYSNKVVAQGRDWVLFCGHRGGKRTLAMGRRAGAAGGIGRVAVHVCQAASTVGQIGTVTWELECSLESLGQHLAV
jgi:hypothetical protein